MSDPYDFFATPARSPAPDPAGLARAVPAAGGFASAPLSRAYGQPQGQPGYPMPDHPGHAPGRRRPGAVTAAAVLVFVQAGIGVLVGLALAVGGLVIGDRLDAAGARAGGIGNGLGLALGLIGLVVVVVGVGFVFLGVQVLRGAQWASITVTVFEALALVGTLGNLAEGRIGSALLGAIIPGVILMGLWSKESRAYLAPR